MLDLTDYVEDLDENMREFKGLRKKVIAKVKSLGLELVTQPMRGKKPLLPKIPRAGISTLTNDELFNLQGQFVEMLAWLGEQIAIKEIVKEQYDEQAKNVLAAAELNAEGTALERRSKARLNKAYQKLLQSARTVNGQIKLLKNRFDGYERARATCSRYVEIRKLEMGGQQRSASIGSSRRPRRSQRWEDDDD